MENNLENEINEEKQNNRKEKRKIRLIIIITIIIFLCTGIFAWMYIYYNAADVAKPIIYLYPEEPLQLNVNLGYPEKITCSYPAYNIQKGWNLTANPDGTLIENETNKKLYALYWEGKDGYAKVTKDGFVIKGENTIEFLEEKLSILGLNYKETEEFIIYWLPKLQNNKYNYIRFATMEEIEKYMPLYFSTKPDSLIRVLMQYKPLDEYIDIPLQKLDTPERTGFTVVEWGGMEIK